MTNNYENEHKLGAMHIKKEKNVKQCIQL